MAFKANLTGIHAVADALEEVSQMSLHISVERNCLTTDLAQDLMDPNFRPTIVRLESARLEGMTACMKRVALRSAEYAETSFSTAELEVLNDDRFVSTIRNADVCWRCFHRALVPGHPQGAPKVNWDQFDAALKIRNRVVHPKRTLDLSISDDELVTFLDGFKLFIEGVTQLANDAKENLERVTKGKRIYRRDSPKIGRNNLCHCNSGLKFKDCHGTQAT